MRTLTIIESNHWSSPGKLLLGALSISILIATHALCDSDADRISIGGPNKQVLFDCWLEGGHFTFSVSMSGRLVVEPSVASFLIDDVELMDNVRIGVEKTYEIDERYPWRGNHSEAVNRCHGMMIFVDHVPSGRQTMVEVRVFNDGVAYRHLASGSESPQIPDEATTFTVPAGARVWFHDMGGHYEGVHQVKEAENISSGQWLAPPVTYQLPGKSGYVAITEAALLNYSGMSLQANGERGLSIRLGHKHPVSYPFRLRYEPDIERLNEPAAIAGDIITPWRVIQVSTDLNGLINSDIVHNCAPAPDAKLFPQGFATPWVQPGRAVWRYLDGGRNTKEEVQRFSNWAGQLGFEYQVVEGFWRNWSDEAISAIVKHSKEQGVGLWFWEHSENLRTKEAQEQFFSRLQKLGVVGAKVDFFDHEHREVVDLYPVLLEVAARHQILVNFHGSNKPTGDQRTWPNELIREGVRGAESRNPPQRARHNATLPFTRYLAGPADYTPVIFGDRRNNTSWAHQIATAVVFTHPLLTYAAHPETLLENPATEVIRTIPSVWDETIALPDCEIGELVVFARRNKDEWYLALLNGDETSRTIAIPLEFLDRGEYAALLVNDDHREAAAVKVAEQVVTNNAPLEIDMIAGGGFVARFVPLPSGEQVSRSSFDQESDLSTVDINDPQSLTP